MIHSNQVPPSLPADNAGMDGQKESRFAAEQLSRPRAIDRIRRIFNALQDEEHCACAVASRYGILCHGFDGLSDREFRDRISWIASKRPRATREELEGLVSQYHLGKEQATGAAVCCDVETREHCACDGWNSFDNKAIEEYCLKLTGRPVEIG
jgi:hypothetical protein